jgi:hypothetical protein
MARIIVTPEHGGHRIWVDKKLVGESPGSFYVPCGSHTVQVGSAGTEHRLELPCGGDIEVK